jgi:hypothetical protein
MSEELAFGERTADEDAAEESDLTVSRGLLHDAQEIRSARPRMAATAFHRGWVLRAGV